MLYAKTIINFFIISGSVLLRMRNVSDKFVEKIKHFMYLFIFDVLLTVHLSIVLVTDQLNAQIIIL